MRLASAALVAAAALHAAKAQAIGACVDSFDPPSPAFRREPLPTNARLFFSRGQGLDVALAYVDDDGEAPVPFALQPADDARASAWIVPDAPLQPGRRLVLRAGGDAVEYVVGDDVDAAPPAAPAVDVVEAAAGDACCANTAVQVRTTPAPDDDGTVPQAVEVRVRSSAGERVVVATWSAIAHVIGASADGCVDGDPDAAPDVEQELFVSTIDFAGNASSAVGPVAFRYPTTDGASGTGDDGGDRSGFASCAATSTGTAAPASLLVALAAARRRRRRRTSHAAGLAVLVVACTAGARADACKPGFDALEAALLPRAGTNVDERAFALPGELWWVPRAMLPSTSDGVRLTGPGGIEHVAEVVVDDPLVAALRAPTGPAGTYEGGAGLALTLVEAPAEPPLSPELDELRVVDDVMTIEANGCGFPPDPGRRVPVRVGTAALGGGRVAFREMFLDVWRLPIGEEPDPAAPREVAHQSLDDGFQEADQDGSARVLVVDDAPDDHVLHVRVRSARTGEASPIRSALVLRDPGGCACATPGSSTSAGAAAIAAVLLACARRRSSRGAMTRR